MLDTKVGSEEKDDPAMVAQTGYRATLKGESDVVSGVKNKIQSAVTNIVPNCTCDARLRRYVVLMLARTGIAPRASASGSCARLLYKALEVGCRFRRLSRGSEYRARIVLEKLEPLREILRMVRTDILRDLELRTQKGGADFCD